MRKSIILYLAIGLCAVTACTDDEGLKIPTEDIQAAQTNPIIEAAQRAYADCYPSASRNGFVSFFEQDILPVTTLTSRAATPDTVLYIVNEAEGNGFVALTAGARPEILAVSDNGTITDINDIDNPGLQMFFDAATEYATSSITGGGIELPEIPKPAFKEILVTEANEVCEARCTVQWGQSYPTGLYCPNKTAGCVIIAGAQTLSYFESPDGIALTYPDADKDKIALDWYGMKKYVRCMSWSEYYSSSPSRTPYQLNCDQNLGRFCRELGNRVQAQYESSGTGAYLALMANLIETLCPSLHVSKYYSGAPIARNVLGNGIIMMQGSRFNSVRDSIYGDHSYCGAHAWIVDGYRHKIIHHQYYELDSEGNYTYSESGSFTETLDVQHINWGWDGQCNGYFNLGVFSSNASVLPDTDSNNTKYNYSHDFFYYVVTPKLQK